MLMIVWEYMVRKGKVADFEKLYGEDGAWVELFRQSPAYVSSVLLRDSKEAQRYLIADRWETEKDFESFKQEHAARYDELDALGTKLHRAEHLIGRFEDVR